jgi:hypothetical protein
MVHLPVFCYARGDPVRAGTESGLACELSPLPADVQAAHSPAWRRLTGSSQRPVYVSRAGRRTASSTSATHSCRRNVSNLRRMALLYSPAIETIGSRLSMLASWSFHPARPALAQRTSAHCQQALRHARRDRWLSAPRRTSGTASACRTFLPLLSARSAGSQAAHRSCAGLHFLIAGQLKREFTQPGVPLTINRNAGAATPPGWTSASRGRRHRAPR